MDLMLESLYILEHPVHCNRCRAVVVATKYSADPEAATLVHRSFLLHHGAY